MSNQGIEHCESVKKHLSQWKPSNRQAIFPIVANCLSHSSNFYSKWLDIYIEYHRAYQDLGLQDDSINATVGATSFQVDTRYGDFKSLIDAGVPAEVYLFIAEYYELFGIPTNFVIQEGNRFESKALTEEMKIDFNKIVAPPNRRASLNSLQTTLSKESIRRLTYNATETNNPQAWLMFLHEAGHDFYDRRLFSVNPFPTESAIMELMLDLYACHVFGPGYALSLAKYHRKYPGGSGTSHPKESVRVYALMKHVEETKDVLKNVDNDYSKKIEFIYDSLATNWEFLKDFGREEIRTLEPRLEPINKAISADLLGNRIEEFSQFIIKHDSRRGQFQPKLNEIVRMLDDSIPVSCDPQSTTKLHSKHKILESDACN